MGPAEVRVHCPVEESGRNLLRAAMQQLHMSARAYQCQDAAQRISRFFVPVEDSVDAPQGTASPEMASPTDAQPTVVDRYDPAPASPPPPMPAPRIAGPEAVPSPAPPAWPGADSDQVERSSRVEYRTPMEVEQLYPLRVGLLLERHARELLDGLTVRWGRMTFAADEPEPVLSVTPMSPYFRTVPPTRNIKLLRGQDVYCGFWVTPLGLPPDPQGNCRLAVELEYKGVLVGQMDLQVQIQQPFRVWRWEVPRTYWRAFSAVGGAIVMLDAGLNVCQFFANVPASPGSLLGFGLVLGMGASLLTCGVLLWTQASRKQVAHQ